MRRNLSGIFFMSHDPDTGERGPVCFEELSPSERERVTEGRPVEFVMSLANILADRLVEVGDMYDIVRGEQE